MLLVRFNGFSGFPVWPAALVVSVFGFGLFPALEWFAFGSLLLGHLGLWPKKSRNFGVKPVGPVKHITPIKETSTSVVHKQLGKEGLCEDTDSPSVSQTLGELDTSSESSADEPQSIVVKDKNGSNSGEYKAAPWVNLFKDNRNPGEGFQINSIEDQPDVITLDALDMDNVEQSVRYCLVGYFAGRFPGKMALLLMCNSWKVEFQYFVHRSGWLIFKFNDDASRTRVLQGGPYFVFN